MLWVGGLRGAIAYTMAISYDGPYSDQFTDTTLVIIFATVIINGLAAGPLVRGLGLQAKEGGGEEGEEQGEEEPVRYFEFEERFLLPVLQVL